MTDLYNEECDQITLTLEDGSDLVCDVISVFPVKDKNYIALLPSNEDPDAEIFLYRFIENGEEIELENIEDDEEFDMVLFFGDDLTVDEGDYYAEEGSEIVVSASDSQGANQAEIVIEASEGIGGFSNRARNFARISGQRRKIKRRKDQLTGLPRNKINDHCIFRAV